MTQAFPLQWPFGKPRTRSPQQSRFGSHSTFSIATTRSNLSRELRLLGAANVILSTNIELRLDGLPYSNRKTPADAGVAVYFTLKGQPRCFACDRWQTVEENIAALAHTIGALRGIERWGGGDMVEQAFSGFAALPAPSAKKEWWDVLDVGPHNLDSVVIAKYRELAKKFHPDAPGGSDTKMTEINVAFAEFNKERGIP